MSNSLLIWKSRSNLLFGWCDVPYYIPMKGNVVFGCVSTIISVSLWENYNISLTEWDNKTMWLWFFRSQNIFVATLIFFYGNKFFSVIKCFWIFFSARVIDRKAFSIFADRNIFSKKNPHSPHPFKLNGRSLIAHTHILVHVYTL